MEEVTFGQYSLPVLLSFILALVYKFAPDIESKWKVLLSLFCGISLGVLGLFYNSVEPTFKNIVDYILYGAFSIGLSATGAHQLVKKTTQKKL